MRCAQLAVDAVERVCHRVRDLSGLQITLQRKNVVAQNHNVRVLRFGDSPDQEVDLASVAGKVGRDLFADERIRQVANLETTLDRVVIGDGDVIHAALAQLLIKPARIGVAIGKLQPAKEPFFRARAVARVDVEVALAHELRPRAGRAVGRSNPDKSSPCDSRLQF